LLSAELRLLAALSTVRSGTIAKPLKQPHRTRPRPAQSATRRLPGPQRQLGEPTITHNRPDPEVGLRAAQRTVNRRDPPGAELHACGKRS
jgi:hypothetical protein